MLMEGTLDTMAPYVVKLNARLQYHQCVNNEDTAVLLWAIDMFWSFLKEFSKVKYVWWGKYMYRKVEWMALMVYLYIIKH